MIADEQYIFKPEAKRKLFILLAVGILLFVIGVFMAMNSGGHEAAGEHHGSLEITKDLVATTSTAVVAEETSGHHGSPIWLKKIYAALWHNNIYFAGLGLIGLFFVAIQYASQAGWSTHINRIPLAMGQWIPVAGILSLVIWFVAKGDLFHWTHPDLYNIASPDYDKALDQKSIYFFWLGEKGGFPVFFILRMVIFFGLWYWFLLLIKKHMLAEDIDGGTQHWYAARKYSAIFLVIFAVSSSVAAWDWVMSIDPHWFSTMFGWYIFASWWVAGLAAITLIVVNLKEAGYLKMVNSNHLHDLGKFIFAFSIFWAYIWFSQFMLIYYANIPEETVYFINKLNNAPYSWIFYVNLILNFVLPFLLLMTRDSKRQIPMLSIVCLIVIIGHWFDFYNMVTPGIMQYNGGLSLLEIGLALVFFALFLFVSLSALSKMPLVAKNHPMVEESLHHQV